MGYNAYKIQIWPFRSFFQLVGDMDELKKKDYPELNKMKTLVLGDKKVSKGNVKTYSLS